MNMQYSKIEVLFVIVFSFNHVIYLFDILHCSQRSFLEMFMFNAQMKN